MEELVRVSKLMSERGICSRREADRFIKQQLVEADGVKITTLGTKVSPNAKIKLLEKGEQLQREKISIVVHKPIGYVSSQAEKGYSDVKELLIPKNQWPKQTEKILQEKQLRFLAPAGRLDIDSSGLLLLTLDGRVAKQVIGEHSSVEKEYLVRVDGTISPKMIQQLQFGLTLDGKPLKRAKVKECAPQLLQIILKEGKKRQIRRMCELVGLHVLSLKRVRIGSILLGNLPSGKWRFFTPSPTTFSNRS